MSEEENGNLEPIQEEVDASKIVLDTPLERSFTVVSFRVRVLELKLNHSVRLGVIVEGTKGSDAQPFHDYKEMVIEGAEYAAWSNDDSHITNIVRNNLSTMF